MKFNIKRLLALLLTFCTCISICAVLSSCGGSANPYQEYAKSGTKLHEIEISNGTNSTSEVTNYYLLKGKFEVISSGRFIIPVTETKRSDIDNNANTKPQEIYVDLYMVYDFRDNILTAYVNKYYFRTEVLLGSVSYTWQDGIRFESAKDNDTTLSLTSFKFNMDKYFANGELTANDAEEVPSLKKDYLVSDSKGLTTSTYTERNPDWEAVAIESIISTVNATLKEVDTYVNE